jgi:hypothetical protein
MIIMPIPVRAVAATLAGALALSMPIDAAPLEDVQHVNVWREAGRYGGWPANHGMWAVASHVRSQASMRAICAARSEGTGSGSGPVSIPRARNATRTPHGVGSADRCVINSSTSP